MVDRTARDRLIAAIEEFLDEKIGAFEFDDRISSVTKDTEDQTVDRVGQLLWYHYDDVKDHTAALSRVEWDYFQRLLLLLRSDSSLRLRKRPTGPFNWTGHQAVALTAALVFVAAFFLLGGLGWKLLLATIPLGLVSMALSRRAAKEPDDPESWRLTPYRSVSELLGVRRTVPGFRKKRQSAAMESRRIRSQVEIALITVQCYVLWLIFSPVVLLYQALPCRGPLPHEGDVQIQ